MNHNWVLSSWALAGQQNIGWRSFWHHKQYINTVMGNGSILLVTFSEWNTQLIILKPWLANRTSWLEARRGWRREGESKRQGEKRVGEEGGGERREGEGACETLARRRRETSSAIGQPRRRLCTRNKSYDCLTNLHACSVPTMKYRALLSSFSQARPSCIHHAGKAKFYTLGASCCTPSRAFRLLFLFVCKLLL